MKVLMKIFVAPVVLTLTVLVWVCSAVLYCSAFVFGLAGTLVGLLGLLVLFSGNVQNAVILFFLAFLVSPVGIPMAAAWMVGKVQDVRYAIQDRVFG